MFIANVTAWRMTVPGSGINRSNTRESHFAVRRA